VLNVCFVLSELPAQAFYDYWEVRKGPSFGMTCTLACPYTLLTHYAELGWAAQYGLDAELIRVSLGTEPIEQCELHCLHPLLTWRTSVPTYEITRSFEEALAAATERD
jgi:hypothetical protein